MADVERIAPPVPTLPAPVGRNVGSQGRRRPPQGPPRRAPAEEDPAKRDQPPPEHIDEYV